MTSPLFSSMGGHHVASKTRTDEWLTPPAVLAALGGWKSFNLDPCAPIVRPWPTARRHYTIEDNGLILPWTGRVWMNCPYHRTVIGRWLGRMVDHNHGIALIFARTETVPFFKHVWERASALLFLRGRLDFHRVDGSVEGNAGAPTVLCAYGTGDADVLACCGLDGHFVPLRLPRGFVVLALEPTWREAVAAWMREQRGPVALADLYRAFAEHRKAAANPNYQAKIRQVLQQGPFYRVARGQWSSA